MADFKVRLRERGCPKGVTVQKVCGLARDEDEVKLNLDYLWSASKGAVGFLRGF